MATSEATVNVTVKPKIETPAVGYGLATYLGVILTVLSAVGSIVAALKTNDTATVTAGTSALLVALATIGGRMAQAIQLAKTAAIVAKPVVDAVASYEDHEVDAVTELPTDAEEFAGSPPDSNPVDPDLSEVRGTPLGLQNPEA